MGLHGKYESLLDGKWHWVPTRVDTEPITGVNQISVCMRPSLIGEHPPVEHDRLFAQYETVDSGFDNLGLGFVGSQGRLKITGGQVLAVVMPTTLANRDTGGIEWFIRAWTQEELGEQDFFTPRLLTEDRTVNELVVRGLTGLFSS